MDRRKHQAKSSVIGSAALAIAAIALAWISFVMSNAAINANDHPIEALRWQSDNAAALRTEANAMAIAEMPDWQKVASLARRSLARSVVNAGGFRALGQAVEPNNPEKAERLVRMALQQSRREASAHLWLIAHTRGTPDMGAIVHHLDMALRVEPKLHDTMFPVLIALYSDPTARPFVLESVRSKPSWYRSFAVFGDSRKESILPFSKLVAATGGLGNMKYGRRYEQTTINTLLRNDHYSAAKTFFEHLQGADTGAVKSLAYTHAPTGHRYHPIDWDFQPSGSFDVLLEQSAPAPALEVTVRGPETGIVASKISFFPSGRYLLHIPAATGDVGDDLSMIWQFRCLTDDVGAGTAIDFSISTKRGTDVPLVMEPGCEAQRLDLRISYDGGQRLNRVRVPAPSLTAQQ